MQIKYQPVLAAQRSQVQARPYQTQQCFVTFNLAHLKGGGKPIFCKLVPVVAKTGGFGHPQNCLQITQAAGRLFAVGLEGVGRVFKFVVSLLQLEALGDKKCPGVQCGEVLRLKAVKQTRVAGDQACLEHRGLNRHIAGRLLQAFIYRAHARANLKAGVPATANEDLDAGLEQIVMQGRLLVGQQQQDIDIRAWKQLGSAIAAHRQQGQRAGQAGLLPKRAQGPVGQAREPGQCCAYSSGDSAAVCDGLQQRCLAGSVLRAQFGALSHAGSAKAGACGLPADRVRTS